MAKPLEQRVGGPNSVKSLIENGFYAEGPLAKNKTEIIMVAGKVHRVEPMGVIFNIGTSNEREITVFKPKRQKNT